jgi:hypothetical protein
MDAHNHYYGHSAILAARAGLGRTTHLNALLQHGWTPGSPVSAHFANVPAAAARHLVVWSSSARGWSPADEPRPVEAIGAPWLHLLELLCGAAESDRPRPASPPGRVVGFPFHSNETMHAQGSAAELAQEWRDVHGPMTVSLYFTEVRDPQTVRSYRSAGHEVVTLGDRWDPAFLLRCFALLDGAAAAVSNRLSTAMFYAASLGVPVRVHGDPMRASWDPADDYEPLRARWPEFHADVPDPARQAASADEELGRSDLRSGTELRDLLYRPPRRARNFYYYWAGSPLHTLRTSLGSRRPADPEADAGPAGDRVPVGARLRGIVRASLAYYPRPLPSLPEIAPRDPVAVDRP